MAPVRFLFTLTIFLGSALLFLVEPMVAKLILPKFGGAPAVWTTSMVFFQLALLLGYGYAHLAVKWLGPKRQAIIHAVLFLIALLLLPIVLPSGANVQGSSMPAVSVIGALTMMVGLPFLLVSSGAPLIQRWFAHTDDPLAGDPYFLYSASNLGSMLALLAYPLLIEPRLGLAEQSHLWTIGYGALGVLLVICAVLLKEVPSASHEPVKEAVATDWKTRARWIALAAVPSSLLLGATTHITTAIAPIPLLWVAPLALYLLSFILAFARRRVPTLWIVWPALFLTAGATLLILMNTVLYAKVQVGFHLGMLFFCAWGCHQTLADERPEASRLTEFFFFLALGGVVGGIFNSLVAPLVFKSLAEYPIALCAVAFLLPRPQIGSRRIWLDVACGVIVGSIAYFMIYFDGKQGWGLSEFTTLIVIGVPILVALLVCWRPLGFALSLVAIFGVATATRFVQGGFHQPGFAHFSDRSFFGVHDVYFYDATHRLVHGTTLHGEQDFSNPKVPGTYYANTGPIGQVMAEKEKNGAKPPIAVVGLGAGTMAAYGQPGQIFDFYDIDPTVIKMAENPKFFTYLTDCPAKWKVIEGDARLSLQNAPANQYGVIVLDAFSSDAIPIHLLTREAIQMYLMKIAPDGIIAFHISNRYLDLRPILANACRDLGLVDLFEYDVLPDTKVPSKLPSMWLLAARSDAAFGSLKGKEGWYVPKAQPSEPVWTDDRSSVLSALLAGLERKS